MARPTYTAIVKEIILALGGRLRNKDFLKYANEKYPGEIHEGSLSDHLYAMSVNSPSRLQYPENKKARGHNERLDILYKDENERGVFELYDPAKHGKWTIMLDHNGKTVLAKDGVPLSESSVEIFSFEKLKDVTEHHIRYHQSNYLEIAIRTLLDSENFTMEWDKIGKNVEKLNFGIPPKPSGFGPAAKEMCKEPPGKKVGIKCKYENGRATNTFSLLLATETTEEQIDELKAVCGKGIAQWHAKKMTEKDVE